MFTREVKEYGTKCTSFDLRFAIILVLSFRWLVFRETKRKTDAIFVFPLRRNYMDQKMDYRKNSFFVIWRGIMTLS